MFYTWLVVWLVSQILYIYLGWGGTWGLYECHLYVLS